MTGPWACWGAEAVSGAGQCIEGASSISAPRFSRKRRTSGMASTAPADAISAAGIERVVATCPQIRLPAAIEPKKTIRNTESPRPRTQSGSAVWAETFRLESTAIQESPASSEASAATSARPPRRRPPWPRRCRACRRRPSGRSRAAGAPPAGQARPSRRRSRRSRAARRKASARRTARRATTSGSMAQSTTVATQPRCERNYFMDV